MNMIPLDRDFILMVAPRFSGDKAVAQSRIVGAISAVFAPTLDEYQINTNLRIAHFMGQVTHECAGFRTTEEFASGAAYEGRSDLGNIHPGDGVRYKGRGLIQLTGRSNYHKFGAKLGLDLDDKPELAADPVISLKIACEYWKSRDINAAADRDDLIAVTKLINGGLNGIEERREYLRRAKQALALFDHIKVATLQSGETVVLRRGLVGDQVGELQGLLRVKGYPITVDNDFGSATELAILHFQKNAGLVEDGIVGGKTWAALRT